MKPIAAAGRSVAAALKGRRQVNFDELGYHESPIYERSVLPPGAEIRGPLVVEEPASTTVVFPDQRLHVDLQGQKHRALHREDRKLPRRRAAIAGKGNAERGGFAVPGGAR